MKLLCVCPTCKVRLFGPKEIEEKSLGLLAEHCDLCGQTIDNDYHVIEEERIHERKQSMKLIVVWVDFSGGGEVSYTPVMAPEGVDMKALAFEHLEICTELKAKGEEVYGANEGPTDIFVKWLIKNKGFEDAKASDFELTSWM